MTKEEMRDGISNIGVVLALGPLCLHGMNQVQGVAIPWLLIKILYCLVPFGIIMKAAPGFWAGLIDARLNKPKEAKPDIEEHL